MAKKPMNSLVLTVCGLCPAEIRRTKGTRKGQASNEQRVSMVKKAIAGNPHFELSLIEMNEDGYTYTYRTLERLKEENPDTDYYFYHRSRFSL